MIWGTLLHPLDNLKKALIKHFSFSFLVLLTVGVESLPDDMQRNISQMRELDLHYQGLLAA